MAAAASIALLMAVSISYLARRNFGTGAVLSYVQGVLPRWAVCIVAGTLLLGYIIGPSTLTMWTATYLSSLLYEMGFESAATPAVGRCWSSRSPGWLAPAPTSVSKSRRRFRSRWV